MGRKWSLTCWLNVGRQRWAGTNVLECFLLDFLATAPPGQCWWFFQVGCCAHAWHRQCGVLHWQDATMTWSIKGIRAIGGEFTKAQVFSKMLSLFATPSLQYFPIPFPPSADFYLTQSSIPHTFGRDHFDVLYVRISYEYRILIDLFNMNSTNLTTVF